MSDFGARRLQANHSLALAISLSASRRTRGRCVFELATFCRRYQGPELDKRLLLLSLDWPSFFNVRKKRARAFARLRDEELAWLKGFSCRKAHCFKPTDRATVLKAVREEWGSEEAFDDFVRNELPLVLVASKRKYQTRGRDQVLRTFDLVFGD